MKTGNVKQVANFEQLVSTATALGAGYNPAKASNKLPALNALLAEALQSLQAVKAAEVTYINATNARVAAFDGIDRYMTRMVNALASSDAPKEMVEDAMKIKKRTTGTKPANAAADRPHASGNTGAAKAMEDPPSTPGVGTSDYDNQAMQFGKLISLMASEVSYAPNENDLKIETLNAYHNLLQTRNQEATHALVALRMARMRKNDLVYSNGIYSVAGSVKRYLKAAFGARSQVFSSVGGLQFRKN